jgi:hypothetical protein
MNAYYFIVVPFMAVMCILFVCIIAGDIKSILRSMRGSGKYDTIRHKTGKSYGSAAIFIGTACLFTGTPQECDELADDLWHRGVQCEVSEVTGEETFDIL